MATSSILIGHASLREKLRSDGSFVETLYGANGQPVAGHVVAGQAIAGQQVTKIDQQGIATDYFYDISGRLTDVWQPAVADALNRKRGHHWNRKRGHH